MMSALYLGIAYLLVQSGELLYSSMKHWVCTSREYALCLATRNDYKQYTGLRPVTRFTDIALNSKHKWIDFWFLQAQAATRWKASIAINEPQTTRDGITMGGRNTWAS